MKKNLFRKLSFKSAIILSVFLIITGIFLYDFGNDKIFERFIEKVKAVNVVLRVNNTNPPCIATGTNNVIIHADITNGTSCTKNVNGASSEPWNSDATPIGTDVTYSLLIGSYSFRLLCYDNTNPSSSSSSVVNFEVKNSCVTPPPPSAGPGRKVEVIIKWKDFGIDQEEKYTEYLMPLQ